MAKLSGAVRENLEGATRWNALATGRPPFANGYNGRLYYDSLIKLLFPAYTRNLPKDKEGRVDRLSNVAPFIMYFIHSWA